jgi:hypothetical protein
MRKQHPQHEQIRELLGDGRVPNAAIARHLNLDVRVIARVRDEAGLPPAPRTSWSYRPHPKTLTIRVLLDEGYSNKAIRDRTGADVDTIARIRAHGAFGPATIANRIPRPHPKDTAIRALINEGKNNEAIARELRTDRAAIRRIRRDLGVPNPPQQPLTLEQKWATRTKPVDGGHMEWTGQRGNAGGTPLLRYREKFYTAAAIAFRQRTGRDPVGHVMAECDMPQCVAPDHVEDEPGRQHLREQLRHLRGMGERPPRCHVGHDQAEHGKYERDGRAYCDACKTHASAATRSAA